MQLLLTPFLSESTKSNPHDLVTIYVSKIIAMPSLPNGPKDLSTLSAYKGCHTKIALLHLMISDCFEIFSLKTEQTFYW